MELKAELTAANSCQQERGPGAKFKKLKSSIYNNDLMAKNWELCPQESKHPVWEDSSRGFRDLREVE